MNLTIFPKNIMNMKMLMLNTLELPTQYTMFTLNMLNMPTPNMLNKWSMHMNMKKRNILMNMRSS